MTAVNAQAAGFATVYPCGQSLPIASNLNYVAGQTIPNLVIAKPGVSGKVCIYSYSTIDVLADVSGFFPAGSGFTPILIPGRSRRHSMAEACPIGGHLSDVTRIRHRSDMFARCLSCWSLNGQGLASDTRSFTGRSGGLSDLTAFLGQNGFTPIANPTHVLDTRRAGVLVHEPPLPPATSIDVGRADYCRSDGRTGSQTIRVDDGRSVVGCCCDRWRTDERRRAW